MSQAHHSSIVSDAQTHTSISHAVPNNVRECVCSHTCRSFRFSGECHQIFLAARTSTAHDAQPQALLQVRRRQQAVAFGHLVEGYRAECLGVRGRPPELAVWDHAQLDQLAVVAQPGLLPLEGSYGLLVHAAPVEEQADFFVTAALVTEALLVGITRSRNVECHVLDRVDGSKHRQDPGSCIHILSHSQPCFRSVQTPKKMQSSTSYLI